MVTATTITAMRTARSRAVEAMRGSMESRYRMEVMAM